MKKKWFAFSLSSHLGLSLLICLIKPTKKMTTPEPKILVKPISKKELDLKLKKFNDSNVAQSAKDNKKSKKDQKIYLSDKNNQTEKNTRAKKTGEFIEAGGSEFQESKKSTTQKGKYNPETPKGKGVSASDDFIAGAEIGPKTILNTQEYKYANYYLRIKQAVVENWRPIVRKSIQTIKSDEKQYGVLEIGYKITKLEIILDSKGEILEIKLVDSSGFKLFDDSAIKAFRKSAPFAAPPKDLIKDGSFSIRWDFIVNVEPAGLVELKAGQVQ